METQNPKREGEINFTAYFNRSGGGFFLLFTDDRGIERTLNLNDEYDVGEKITSLIQEYENSSEL